MTIRPSRSDNANICCGPLLFARIRIVTLRADTPGTFAFAARRGRMLRPAIKLGLGGVKSRFKSAIPAKVVILRVDCAASIVALLAVVDKVSP